MTSLTVPALAQPASTPPLVSITALDSEAAENSSTPLRFLINRSGDSSAPLTVSYQPSGTALNGVDFWRLTGRITIPAGSSSVILTVQPIDDTQGEPTETVTLRLISPTNSFTLAILPDTQYYTGIPVGATNNTGGLYGGSLAMFAKQTQWIVDHRDDWNISFVLHEGDCTEFNQLGEWQNVRSCMDTLNGVVPYAIAVGNHDGIEHGQHNTALFNQHYPLANAAVAGTVGGIFESNRLDNCYHLFSAGGVDWLLFSLEFGPRNAVLDWANTVTTNYPNRKVIMLTHAHVAADNTLLTAANPNHTEAPKKYARPNDGVDVWEKFLRRHPNIMFAFNGHIGHGGLGQVIGIGDAGNKVYQFACNYQFNAFGGAGYMRVLKFYPDQDKFEAQSFSPYFGSVYTDSRNQFAYTNLEIFTNLTPTYLLDSSANSATGWLTSEDPDSVVAAIERVLAYGFPSRIHLRFDRPITSASATNLANYQLFNGPGLVKAQLLSDGRTVELSPAADLNPNEQYQIVVTDIQCLQPTAITNPPPQATNFTFEASLLAMDFPGGSLGNWVAVDQGNLEAPSAWLPWNGGLGQFNNIYGPGNVTVGRRGTFAYYSNTMAFAWSNYVFSTTLRSMDDDGIGVMFAYRNPQNYYKFDMDQQRNFRKLFRVLNGVETTLASQSAGYVTGANYRLTTQFATNGITISLNGQVLFGGSIPDTTLPSGTIACYSWGNAGSFFSNITVVPIAGPPPQITIVNPTNFTQITNSAPIEVIVNTTNSGFVGISQVEYLLNGSLVRRVFQSPYQTSLAGVEGGAYQLDARVIDSLGRQSWATPVQLNVPIVPRLLRLWNGSSGEMRLEFQVQPTTPLALQASSNLITWEPLGTWSNLNPTPLSILDPASTNASMRFYRAIVPEQ
jgi:hypothetical protein